MTEILTPITERTPTASSTGYLPIEEHGVIGDLRSVAFVGTNGTIDWYCPGRFDAPSVFASLLDSEKGGHFRIQPADGAWKSRQLYFPDTNVLITRFSSKEGVAEVIDFMPVMPPGARTSASTGVSLCSSTLLSPTGVITRLRMYWKVQPVSS